MSEEEAQGAAQEGAVETFREAQVVSTMQEVDADSEYEFTVAENEVFMELGSAMRYCAGAWLLLCLVTVLLLLRSTETLEGVTGLLAVTATAFAVVTLTAMAWWTWGAAGNVFLLVRTEGRDITHLMRGLRKLRKLFWLQVLLIIIFAVTGINILAWFTLSPPV